MRSLVQRRARVALIITSLAVCFLVAPNVMFLLTGAFLLTMYFAMI